MTLYASLGPELTQYDVDVDSATLVKRGSVTLPANIQYAWPHASKQYLYVASSSRPVGSIKGAAGNTHHVSALRIDSASGALQPLAEPIALRHRPVHMTTDIPSEHALIAYTDPSAVSVHRINRDGSLGDEVKQQAAIDTGIYAHQIRIAPSNRLAVLVTRGNDATDGKAEDPGALKVFDYQNGVLTNRDSIAPAGGYGFGPRHLDFHPTLPWVFVSLERQNRLYVHKLERDTLSEPIFRVDTVADPASVRREHKQLAGTIHVHPAGGFVYVINRAYATQDFEGTRIFSGGENSIAVYAVDPATGEPTLIQSVDTRGVYARTFAIDPSGRLLIAANGIPMVMKDGATLNKIPASLALFRIASDGKLDYVRKYEVDVGSSGMFWANLV